MKKLLSVLSLLICICMIMTSCKLSFGSTTLTDDENSKAAQQEAEENDENDENDDNGSTGGNKASSKKSTSKSSGGSGDSTSSGGSSTPAKPVPGGAGSKCAVIAGGSSLRNRGTFTVPSNLMTTEQYQKELGNMLKGATNFTNASADYLKKLDNLDVKLQEQIVFNTADVTKCSSTHYYVSADGNDKNDGKSPEKAWKTIAKVNNTAMKRGDLVSFRRGDSFRGIVAVKSGVTYGAYGSGYKPQILGSFDGKKWKWVKTDKANVWKLDHLFSSSDSADFPNNNSSALMKDLVVSVLVKPDGSEKAGIRCTSIKSLKSNGAFCYCGPVYKGSSDGGQKNDGSFYLYCDAGNPNDVYTDIEIGVNLSVFNENNNYIEDVKLNNLEILYGRGPFWPGECKNISVTYCIAGWQGGFDDGTQGVPYGGGGGCWGKCDNFLWDHCYIFQQWDSGVSPQYKGSSNPVVTYKDFVTTNCLFKGCKWTLEYWLYQKETTKDIIDHLVFDYNICRDGGNGFNDYRRSESCYVQTWGYESTCYNSSISHNVFDRPYAQTYEIGGFEQLKAGTSSAAPQDKFSIDRMPKMEGNIHLQQSGKNFAYVHKGHEYRNTSHDLYYTYTKESLQKFINDGFEKNSLFLFASR